MSSKGKKRTSRARPGFIRESWQARIHPAFAHYWASLKKNGTLPKVRDQRQSDRQFEQWFREFSTASKAYDDARDQIQNPIGPKIQSAVLKRLDIEGPM